MRKTSQDPSRTRPCARLRNAVCLIAVACAAGACGCHIPNQAYRDKMSIISLPTAPVLPMASHTAWPPHPETRCDEKALRARPCLAFLEFDEFGEAWEKTPTGRPTQLNAVRELIRRAKVEDPMGQPLILTFIHGWKHNSSDGGKKSGADDSNVIGLASTLNELAANQYQGHVVIGIYISWRGGLISPYWPVAQQFTYWNREATAIRVGNTSLTEALIEISDAAHAGVKCDPGDACPSNPACSRAQAMTLSEQSSAADQSCSPILLFVGHSFGALVMERAISQAMVTRLERQYSEEEARRNAVQANAMAAAAPAADTPIEFVPLANLIIFVNSAAAATESKQMMDYLASSKFTYGPAGGTPRKDQPLFLSVTSESDSATGVFLKVGHAVPWLGYKFNGSLRSGAAQTGATTSYARACFEPATGVPSVRFDLSQGDYYLTTTAHRQELWSHSVTPRPTTGRLDDLHCTPANSAPGLYTTCRIGQLDYDVKPIAGRCNGTPYWVIQVQKEIVPDHNTIFTDRLIAFLTPFIPQPAPGGEVPVPMLSRPPLQTGPQTRPQ
jgi:hypothetical protein